MLAARHVVDQWFREPLTTPLDVQQRYLDALDRGDVAGALAAFSPDAVYHGGNCQPSPCVGPAAIEQAIVRSVADDTHLTIHSAQVEGNHLTWSGELTSGDVRASGFDHLAAMGSMLADGDAIVDYRVWLDNADTLTALYVQELESVYRRAPGAPEPDTKHALE